MRDSRPDPSQARPRRDSPQHRETPCRGKPRTDSREADKWRSCTAFLCHPYPARISVEYRGEPLVAAREHLPEFRPWRMFVRSVLWLIYPILRGQPIGLQEPVSGVRIVPAVGHAGAPHFTDPPDRI